MTLSTDSPGSVCPKCGTVMSFTAMEGLCPRCLFAQLEDVIRPDQTESGGKEPGEGLVVTELGTEREFGDYELLEEIGQGGMGVVYRARQLSLNRPVAVKVIKMGMDTRSVIARFEGERQALALMDHPGIARVIDAGATQAGRPYFVMELVRGEKITDYCQKRQLSTNQRLGLFIKVCHAVQHAHQKGIIHRDLKPSNILVTELDGQPLPKIIDFGIAKAIEGRLADQTLFTVVGQFVGTPAYLSPEQAEMGRVDIDTRSDIYSLGVLLYELLTGSLPFEPKAFARASLQELQRTIREVTPVRPSTRLRRTGAASTPGIPNLNRRSPLATDLDWIVMKCLEKDRARRYETANGLATDLQRHLSNEPVSARPPSRLYEFQKSVRRHKVGFAATAIVILALTAGVLVSSWQARVATDAKREAIAARTSAQAQELGARRRAYASDMMMARQYLTSENLGGALELLDRQRPELHQEDLRGWEWRYLWQRTRSEALFTLGQTFGRISALAVSADTNWLAVGHTHLGGLSLWDLRTRREVIRLGENEAQIRASFSPTEPLLAFAGASFPPSGKKQSTLHLWDAAKRKLIRDIPLDATCAGLSFSQDGRTLVTSTVNGHITLWQVPDGIQITNFPSDQSLFEDATCFAATPDLSLAAYTFYPIEEDEHWIRVVNLRNGKELWTARAAKFVVTSLAFSPDGRILASARGIGESPVITLWDALTGTKTEPFPAWHRNHIFSMLFWPDGTRLVSACGDQTIRIWSLANHKCLDVLRGQAEPVKRVALSPDGRTLISGGSRSGTVCFWDTSVTHRRPAYFTVPAKVLAWSFTPDSQSVVTLLQSGQVARWRGTNFQHKEPLVEIGTNLPGIYCLYRFSEDGRFLAAGSFDGVLQVWDLSQRHCRQWTNTAGRVLPMKFGFSGHELVTWSEADNLLHKWDIRTGAEIRSVPVPPWPTLGSALAPDGSWAVVTDVAGTVRRVSLVDGSTSTLNPPVLEAHGAGFSRDGRWLAISSTSGGYVRVWDTTTGTALATNLYGLFSAAFSPDTKRLATGGGGGQAVTLLETESWESVLTLDGQDDGFEETAFSPDGNIIGSLNTAGTNYFWRAPSLDEIEATERAAKDQAHTR